MKVKELIEILEEHNLEADVYVVASQEEYNFDYFYSSNGYTEKTASNVFLFMGDKKKSIKESF